MLEAHGNCKSQDPGDYWKCKQVPEGLALDISAPESRARSCPCSSALLQEIHSSRLTIRYELHACRCLDFVCSHTVKVKLALKLFWGKQNMMQVCCGLCQAGDA